MKLFLFLLLIFSMNVVEAQNQISITLNDKKWEAKNVSAGIEKVMDLTAFAINAIKDSERIDIMIDYNAIKGKTSAEFTFEQNFSVPPGGASISYAPRGLGKQQWVSAEGKIHLTEFDETNNTASGTFEGTIKQLLDDKGGFVLKNQPSMKISGKFEKVKFKIAN